jgi:hypothetical protein
VAGKLPTGRGVVMDKHTWFVRSYGAPVIIILAGDIEDAYRKAEKAGVKSGLYWLVDDNDPRFSRMVVEFEKCPLVL